MSEKLTRRDFNKILGTAIAVTGLSLAFGCSKEEPQRKTPEFVITNNGKITSITNVDVLAGKDIGINTISFYPSDNLSKIAVILDRGRNTALTFNKIDPQTYHLKDGFVPFDPTFNLKNALSYLEKQHQFEKPVLPTPDELRTLAHVTGGLVQNDPGIFFTYKIPQLNAGYMYVLDSRNFFTVNGNSPPPTILRAQFVFMKFDQHKEGFPSQSQQL